MRFLELIARKRDGGRIPDDAWRPMMQAYATDEIPDYQMAAMAMAIVLRGLDPAEIEGLTTAMLESGARFSLGHLPMARVDKHSTGGLGDKVSLILAPLVAACGVAVPMMSGRSLGHTGGTLDKLEAIPGFRTGISIQEAEALLVRHNCAMLGQTAEIAPADRKLYALRGATATVEAIPLIAASIMSKKLAEDLNGLVLDVKTGAGAFLPDQADALALARTMIDIGERRGCRTVALLTDMDAPLGEACGNALEVAESVAVLRGGGPADVREVTVALAAEMLVLGGVAPDRAAGRTLATAALDDGRALARFRVIVEAQGGDPRVADDPWGVMARAPITQTIAALAAGVVQRVEPRAIGAAIIALGGGRSHTDDVIDPAVGVMVQVRPGQRVEAGDPLLVVHASESQRLAAALEILAAAVPIGAAAPPKRPLISHRVTAGGVEELPGTLPH